MGGTSRVPGGCLGPLCERACRTDFRVSVYGRTIRLARVVPGCAACRQRSGPARMHRLTADSRIERRDARARHCSPMRPKFPATGAAATGLGRNLTETLVQDRSFPGRVGMRWETTSHRLDLCGCGTELCRQAHLIHEFSGFTGASPTRFAPLASASNLKANCD